MKLPGDSIISESKIKDYLLIKQPDSNKSLFLESAGYNRNLWEQLEKDIRLQLLPLEAEVENNTPFGEKISISGTLTGPNGKILKVRTIWIKRTDTSKIHFVTLLPDRRTTR